MITPYHFDLNGDSPEVLQTLPDWSKSSMPFATCRLLYKYNTIQILSQQLNQYRMDRKTESRLEKIYTYPKQKTEGLDGHLRKYISYILKHYDKKIAERDADLSYELKTYLDEHFCDPGLSVSFLSDYFSVTSQTLLNRQYNITIQNYYTSLRMEKALHMIRTKTHACF